VSGGHGCGPDTSSGYDADQQGILGEEVAGKKTNEHLGRTGHHA